MEEELEPMLPVGPSNQSTDQPQLQVGVIQHQQYGSCISVQQQTAVNIEDRSVSNTTISNTCVICLSVFACVCCSSSMGAIALLLALVARAFHSDPEYAAKAALLNRYGLRLAILVILIGLAIYVLIGISFGAMILWYNSYVNSSPMP